MTQLTTCLRDPKSLLEFKIEFKFEYAAVTVRRQWPPPTDTHCLIPYITASGSKTSFPLLSTPFGFLAIAPALLYFQATATRCRLAGALATRSLIPSAPSFAMGSWCFSSRSCSLSFTLPTPTPDPVTDFCQLPMSSSLLAFHHWPSGAQCPRSSCAARELILEHLLPL
jgi:hypothetical protein